MIGAAAAKQQPCNSTTTSAAKGHRRNRVRRAKPETETETAALELPIQDLHSKLSQATMPNNAGSIRHAYVDSDEGSNLDAFSSL